LVIAWYKAAFSTTQLSARYPIKPDTVGIGLNDGSFTLATLDGAYNGGQKVSWYFWPRIVEAGQANFWRTGTMGGEIHPSQQADIYSATYPGGTFENQWIDDCINVTHTSSMLNHGAFVRGGYTGVDLDNARAAAALMGYNFVVSSVAAAESVLVPGSVDFIVEVTQIGVAPFYYDLSLALNCANLGEPLVLPGVETLIDQGASKLFEFIGVPATEPCLSAVTLSLESSYAYEAVPILFAQGDGSVVLDVPLP